jgi:GT2 family glycosyltransferase
MNTVSVIIVVWNNVGQLSQCLQCLERQTFPPLEVVIIDNGSSDNSTLNLREKWSALNLHIIKLEKNEGFAIANNLAVRHTRGQWLALLNADAFPEPDWLERLARAAESNPEFTFFTSRQIQANAPDLLDGTGDIYHISGLAWRDNYNQLAINNGLESQEVFSACAAAALYSRDEFLKAGGFDEDYFSYFEDVDLSFRMRLAGGRCLYVPQAVVHHVGSASSGKVSDFVVYHGHRNLEFTYFKDMPGTLLLLYLPLHILMDLFFMISFLFKGKGRAFLKAKIDAVRYLPGILQKRRHVQNTRIVSIKEIHRIMSKGLFAPYWASRRRVLSREGEK